MIASLTVFSDCPTLAEHLDVFRAPKAKDEREETLKKSILEKRKPVLIECIKSYAQWESENLVKLFGLLMSSLGDWKSVVGGLQDIQCSNPLVEAFYLIDLWPEVYFNMDRSEKAIHGLIKSLVCNPTLQST